MPSGARVPSMAACSIRSCGSLTSNVRIVTRCGAASTSRGRRDTAPPRSAPPSRRPRAGTPSGTGRSLPRPARCARAASSGASMLASSRISTPSSVTAGRSRYSSSDCSCGLAPRCRASICSSVFGVGVDQHLAGRAVDGDHRARRDEHAGVVQAGDRRHVQRAREDRGVVRPAAGVGHERGQPLPVELRDRRRRHVVRDEDQRSLEVLEEVGRDRRPRAGSSSAGRRRRRRRPCARAGSGSSAWSKSAEMCSSARCSADSAFSRSVRIVSAARSTSIASSSISSCASKR